MIVRFPVERHPGVLEELRHAVAQYQETVEEDRREVLRRYYFGDFARKVVGVGSVGTEAFVLLLLGDRADEPLFLQVKEAQESVLAPFAGESQYQHQGERVVRGQRLTQAATDPFLGWTSGIGTSGTAIKDYYVRQLRDMKGSMSVPLMDPLQLNYYGRLCGWALARAHARTGRASLISGYLGSGEDFDHAVADFAVAYADQNEQDYRRVLEAISAGRVPGGGRAVIAGRRRGRDRRAAGDSRPAWPKRSWTFGSRRLPVRGSGWHWAAWSDSRPAWPKRSWTFGSRRLPVRGSGWHWAAWSGHCPVDLSAMAYSHDQDEELPVHDFVDDPVVPDAQPVTVVVSGELLDAGIRAARIVPQRRQRPQYRERGWLRDGLELPDGPVPPPERVLHAAPLPGSSSKIAATTSDML